jgi:hypothetical protein
MALLDHVINFTADKPEKVGSKPINRVKKKDDTLERLLSSLVSHPG